MSLDLNKSVVITGGGTGIGLAAARSFADAGAQVWITGRRREVLERAAADIGAHAVSFDATDPGAIRGALDLLPARVDVLVNNADGQTDFASTKDGSGDPLERTRAAWRANLESNLVSAVLVTQALGDRLADDARVVNLGSIAGRAGSGSGGYGAAKAGVEAWTVDLARELGPRGITVNVVSPGLVGATEFFGDNLTDERRAALVAATFTGRAGTVEDVAAAIAFLASAQAGHVTGQVLPVNGGAQLAR